MTMIERVARAIHASLHNEPELWDHQPNLREQCMKQARAAIAAMREPSDEMVATNGANWGRHTWVEYQQVIDAALSEGE